MIFKFHHPNKSSYLTSAKKITRLIRIIQKFNNMKKWFLNIALFLSAWSVQAHQTEISSTMLVEQDNNKWVLQIRSALTAFDQTIKAAYPPYESAEAFQAIVLQHLKDNLQIKFNDQAQVTLQNGVVKLGHETSVVFEVVGVPENIESVFVKNSSFKTINRSQGALLIFKKGFEQKQFTLNSKNDYGLQLQAANNQFRPVNPTLATDTNYAYMMGVVFVLIGLGLLATSA